MTLKTTQITSDLIKSRFFQNWILKNKQYNKQTVEKFISIYIEYIPKQYLEFLSPEDLLEFLLERFYLFHRLPEAKSKNTKTYENYIKPIVNINMNPSEFWLSDSIILQIITNDMPFTIDSLSYLFHENNLTIKIIIHPTFYTKRKDNKLIDIEPVSNKISDHSFTKESYSFFIFEKKENLNIKNFIKSITDLLCDIRYIVSDYNKMINYANGFKETSREFFEWLKDDNFLFLGIKSKNEKIGLFNNAEFTKNIPLPNKAVNKNEISFFRLNYESKIKHKRKIIAVYWPEDFILIGIFTRKADNTTSTKIPILLKRIESFQKKQIVGVLFDRNDFVNSLNLFPLEYRLTNDPAHLLPFCEIINIARIKNEKKIKILRIKKDEYYLVIMWPEKEFSDDIRTNIKKFLEKNNFKIKNHVIDSISVMVYLYHELEFSGNLPSNKNLEDFLFDIEENLKLTLLSWDERTNFLIEKQFTTEDIEYYQENILPCITRDYKIKESGNAVIRDMRAIHLLEGKEFHISIYYDNEQKETELKLFYKIPQTLSALVPILDNLGLEALREESFLFELKKGNVYIYKFYLKYNNSVITDKEVLKKIVNSLKKILEKRVSSEPINSLVMKLNLSIQQVQLLKSLAGYIGQIKKGKTPLGIKRILLTNLDMTLAIVHLFENSLLPKYLSSANAVVYKEKTEKIKTIISDIPCEKEKLQSFISRKEKTYKNYVPNTLLAKETWESFYEILSAIKRSNYFVNVDYISLKIKSSEILSLPFPKPFFEIWVYHSNFEGIHIRGGLIARGGLRWSDRQADFRTEVAGLWKTQMLKNTVIIPTGSKGGFVIKYLPQTIENAIWAYKNFITALLEITDNLKNEKVIHPPEIPVLDNDDPYLVVAADKGTAAFSDFANEISTQNNFWLDDAFASGGKNGYSHKALGVTARGAWESARWHFYKLNKDPATDVFTVAGIGDMLGDVFGNGMLLSDKIKLIAAFNHKHIFIDPNPDTLISFKERKRLFEKPKSQWSDYDTKLISKGGGIFDRSAVTISINAEIQNLFNITKQKLSGEELVQEVLKAPVDMLFNGGIGTYVKSETEDNADVGDKANDLARINASELRAKMIIEGGNLGMTPLARIEFALKGGFVNTDAIDNSGGVDTSDHEVNLKILLNILAFKKLEKRNDLLKTISNEVVSLVMQNNFRQNNAVIYNQKLPAAEQPFILMAVEQLEKENILKRKTEYIPEQATLEGYIKNQGYIPAPIICILLAYIKFYAQNIPMELNSHFAKDFLMQYFPKAFQKHEKEILKHPLKKDIKKTMAINHVIDHAGIGFFEKSRLFLNLTPPEAIENYLTAENFLGAREYRNKEFLVNNSLRTFPQNISLDSVLKIQYAMELAIFRFIEMMVLFNGSKINTALKNNSDFPCFPYSKWQKSSLPEWIIDFSGDIANDLAEHWLHLEIRFILFFILKKTDQKEINDFFGYYFQSGIFDLKKCLYNIYPTSKWEAFLLINMKKDFWNGLVKSYKSQIWPQKKGVDLLKELEILKEKNNLNLSSLGGLISFLLR
ncbi:MAG: NAD-glutamate dehydrogenase [Spirochaetia bacterium]|nr:NAD-glutamate dehydrogenase [Spirochaetia bacterium]